MTVSPSSQAGRNRRRAFRPASLLSTFLVVALSTGMLSLTACTKTKASANADDSSRIKVITTVFASYDFTRQIAGPYADVRMLVPPGSEIHSFEPTPQDILDIEGCDLFIYVGGESDAWLNDLLASIDTSNVRILKLVDCVETMLEDKSVLVDSDSLKGDAREADTGEADEHVWTSIENAKAITIAISSNLMSLDRKHTTAFDENAQSYLQQLDELDTLFRNTVEAGDRTTLIFGDRFPFLYLATEYGLQCYAAFPGCSSATEPSARTVASLIDIVNEKQIPVVFYIELSNHGLADVIAQETGAQALMLHSCHNISAQDFAKGETYISLMKNNAENLKVALS